MNRAQYIRQAKRRRQRRENDRISEIYRNAIGFFRSYNIPTAENVYRDLGFIDKEPKEN